MKVLIFLMGFICCLLFSKASFADEVSVITNEPTGFNMSLSEDLVQIDPRCNQKRFIPAFGPYYKMLNPDQTTSSDVSGAKNQ